ncbi:hypothetical protein STEG23_006815 [Scotinomys teguina]
MARKAGKGKEEEESRARQQEEKTPVREEEEKPACHGGAHHVVEQGFPKDVFTPRKQEVTLRKQHLHSQEVLDEYSAQTDIQAKHPCTQNKNHCVV